MHVRIASFFFRLILVSFVFIFPTIAISQCAANAVTTTFASNNGQDGNMFDVVAVNDVEIFCIDGHFNAGTINYEIYYRLGTIVGSQNTPGAWFLAGSGSVASGGNGNPTPLSLSSPIQVCAGTTVGFYVTNTGGALPNARYTNGTAVGAVFSSDANIELREGYGKSYPFGVTFQPRVFNGTVRYNTIVLCTPLPIELLDFNAKTQEEVALIEWSTASERNNEYFTVEKSIDGIEWIEVGEVAGAGNSVLPLYYEFIDENPFLGISYYRLKQTDFDGSSTYSAIKSVEFARDDLYTIGVYPNPADGHFIIKHKNIEGADWSLSLADGRDVSNRIAYSLTNKDELKIDATSLSPGVYFLQVNKQSIKIVLK